MSAVTFFVAGIPIPQGSKTAYVVGKRAVLTDANKKLLKPWRAEVTRIARAVWLDRVRIEDVAVRVEATFVFERPKSVKRPAPSVKPDVDKLARALLDGITDSGIWKDDSQVTDLHVEKVYGAAPGVHVVISRTDVPLAGEEKAA